MGMDVCPQPAAFLELIRNVVLEKLSLNDGLYIE